MQAERTKKWMLNSLFDGSENGTETRFTFTFLFGIIVDRADVIVE